MSSRRTKSTQRWLTIALAAGIALGAAISAQAIHPQQWTHATEADLAEGDLEQVVVTNLGDIKLAAKTVSRGDAPDAVSVIYDAQRIGNDTYLAGGPEARLLRMGGDKAQTIAELPGEQIFALDVHQKSLLVAISGRKSRLAELDAKKNELKTLIEMPEHVRYIWDVVVTGKQIYIATGPEGQVYHADLSRRGKARLKLLLDAPQANILSLGRDGQGRLYAGTDTDGLVYRIVPGKGDAESFVLYDAPEAEIGALLVLEDGTVYAGTADANQARPGRMQQPQTDETGRPEEAAEGAADSPDGDPDVPPAPTQNENADKPDTPADETSTEEDSEAAPDEPEDPAPADEAQSNGDTPYRKEYRLENAAHRPAAGPDGHVLSRPVAMASNDSAEAPAQEDGAAEEEPETPTPEQRDALREEIRRRLQEARKTGAVSTSPAANAPPAAPASQNGGQSNGRPSRGMGGGSQGGNAVYRIDTDGIVKTIFRESVMVLRLARAGDDLIVATGNEGQLYRVAMQGGETTTLVDLECEQIPALLTTGQGANPALLLGCANPALLIGVDGGIADQGTYTSAALDATQISLWGTMHVTATIPHRAAIEVQARSGNVSDPQQGAWSKWSPPVRVASRPESDPLTPHEIRFHRNQLPPARFFQYRIKLVAAKGATPVIDRVVMNYVMPNMPPVIAGINAQYEQPRDQQQPGDAPPARFAINLNWEASDPNQDAMRYTLEYQASGSSQWLPLAEDLAQNMFRWDTRRVPDGRYLVRITATDAPDNPAGMALTGRRRSQPLVIDNTPPAAEKLQTNVNKGVVTVTGRLADTGAMLAAVHHAVDGTDQWQAVLPDDLIFDSTTESITITISDLSPGPHVVTVRAVDGQGNALYRALTVDVEE